MVTCGLMTINQKGDKVTYTERLNFIAKTFTRAITRDLTVRNGVNVSGLQECFNRSVNRLTLEYNSILVSLHDSGWID